MSLSFADFVKGVAASKLMTAEELRVFRESIPAERRLATVTALSGELVRQGRLTAYQAQRIIEGRHQHLVLDKYLILDKIGEGGMGEVYKAEHRLMKRHVAIKMLPFDPDGDDSESAVRRFYREVEAAARLVHANIVTALDANEVDGVHFMVMEFVDGLNLVDLVAAHGPLPIVRAVDCALQVAKGLDYAHRQNVIHRDIKPSNLLIDQHGTVKILDMGLARLNEKNLNSQLDKTTAPLTQSGEIMGTFDYMSPEQAEDARGVDHRSDIYSLGCTLYSLLTADVPFKGDTMMKKLLAHREQRIPDITKIRPDAPPELQEIFARMLAKRAEDRYQSMADVVEALRGLLGEIYLPPSDLDLSDGVAAPLELTAQIGPTGSTSRQPAGITVAQAALDTHSVTGETEEETKKIGVPAVGIDLGTTYSVAARLDDEGRPQTIPNSEGDKITPSVVLFDHLEVLVGKEAARAMSTDMELIAEAPKREVGERLFPKAFDNQQYPPEALEAWILNKLRVDAQRQIGGFEKVVITVPAYFDEIRRKATQDAGYMAGFEVIDIINEPTAAALAFAHQQGLLRPEAGGGRKEKVLVYDLGGGTFDVTIMEIGGNDFRALATDGDVRLGGRDFDERLVDFVAERFRERFEADPRTDPNARGRLWRDCEDAKRTLSARKKASVALSYSGHSLRVEISRDKFESLTSDLLDRTRFTTNEAVRAAGLAWSDIDRVLLVGGATRMPMVQEMLGQLSGREPDRSISPDEAVAHGAALQAGLILDCYEGKSPRFKVRNVSSHSLGVVAQDKRTGRLKNVVLIPRNSPLPATARRTFKTQKAGQKMILVEIVEGESKRAEECSQLGSCTIKDLPPDLPAKTPIDVHFRYEENGRLTVTVKVKGGNQQLRHEIVRQNALSQEQLDNWRHYISGMAPLWEDLAGEESGWEETPAEKG